MLLTAATMDRAAVRLKSSVQRAFRDASKANNNLPLSGISSLPLPFLKWAGGKRWLMPVGVALRSAAIGTYFEPFLGSGALFFSIAPKRAILSDANRDLIETYLTLQADWLAVMDALEVHDERHCEEYYYRIRSSRPRLRHTKAARFIYLNRTCWNGLYRVNRQGIFNTPIGSKMSVLLDSDDFEAISKCLTRAKLVHGDFESQIDLAGANDLVFADPPYTVRHQHNGFIKYNEQLFSWADQERLCASLIRAKQRGAVVICTNADHQSIRELYEPHFDVYAMSRFSSIAGKNGTRGNYAEVAIIG